MNRGFGAGGSNTNANGLPFEEKTCNENYLAKQDWTKHSLGKGKTTYYLTKQTQNNVQMYFTMKCGFKKLCLHLFGKRVFKEPDEAYVFHHKDLGEHYDIVILEKKHQTVDGSVFEKLLAGDGNKKLYEYCLKDTDRKIHVYYVFCLNDYYKQKFSSQDDIKNTIIKTIIEQDYKITILFGGDENYFEKLSEYLNQFTSSR